MTPKTAVLLIALCLLLAAAQVVTTITLNPGESLLFNCTSGVYSVIPYEGEVNRLACYAPVPPCQPFPEPCEDESPRLLYLPMVTK